MRNSQYQNVIQHTPLLVSINPSKKILPKMVKILSSYGRRRRESRLTESSAAVEGGGEKRGGEEDARVGRGGSGPCARSSVSSRARPWLGSCGVGERARAPAGRTTTSPGERVARASEREARREEEDGFRGGAGGGGRLGGRGTRNATQSRPARAESRAALSLGYTLLWWALFYRAFWLT